jgi:hypothetical protein
MELVQIGLLAVPLVIVLLIVVGIVKNAHGPKKGRYKTTATGKQ